MKPMYKKRLLAALRSDEYTKTRGVLVRATTDGDEFCCLGVLADTLDEEFVAHADMPRTPHPFDEVDGLYLAGTKSQVMLPDRILKKVKMSPSEQSDLAEINDTTATFKEVIAYIEDKL